MKRFARQVGILAIFLLSAAGCSSSGGAPEAIESYLRALEAKDDVAAVNTSCLDWEEGAFAEASSFEAVEVSLENLACHESGSLENSTLVRCEGTFVANYGGEIQNIDVSQRTFRAVNEDGLWKMCGYAPAAE